MARVYFTRDFTYKPRPNVAIAYREDNEYTVRREAADQAIAANAAVERKAPRRKAKAE